jgi:hypothetical protein
MRWEAIVPPAASDRGGATRLWFQFPRREFMSDPVFKKIDVVGTSTNSFSEAAANAIAKAAESVRNISWFEVVDQRGSVMEGMVQQYQTTVRIGFRLD